MTLEGDDLALVKCMVMKLGLWLHYLVFNESIQF